MKIKWDLQSHTYTNTHTIFESKNEKNLTTKQVQFDMQTKEFNTINQRFEKCVAQRN